MTALLPILMLLGQSGYAESPLPAIDAALIAAQVRPSDVVFDIGCGDGRVVVLAAKKYGCRAVGIELDGNLARISQQTVIRNGVANLVTIVHGDALKADLSEATVVFCYHQQEFLKMLRPQFERLKPGTRVVFLDHSPHWLSLRPVRTLETDQHTHSIFAWTVGACGVGDSPLVAAGKVYPGVRCFEGIRDSFLVEQAQQCAETLAARGDRAYWRDGHPGLDARFRMIRRTLRMDPDEVSAFSWPNVSSEPTEEIASGLFWDWRRSPGHWAVVSRPHARYGEGLARFRSGVWFGVVIVAD